MAGCWLVFVGLAVFVLAGWLGVGVGVCCGCWRLARGVAWLLGCWLVWSLVGGWLFVVAGWSSACWSRSVGDCITRMQAATAPVLSLACEVLDSANSATLLGFVTYAPIASWWFFGACLCVGCAFCCGVGFLLWCLVGCCLWSCVVGFVSVWFLRFYAAHTSNCCD